MRRRVCNKSRLLVSVLMLSLATVGGLAAAGSWSSTGGMSETRATHTATLLLDGRVLVSGGENIENGPGQNLASAEIYDPNQGTWSAAAAMASKRRDFTATVLPVDGRVLVIGGFSFADGGALLTAEIYDPVNNSWAPTASMTIPRFGHTATLLKNGLVLVVGGNDNVEHLASAEIYDPSTGTWSTTGSMAEARGNHTATLLQDGRVLVAGGWDQAVNLGSATAEIYDPTSGTWSAAGSMSVARISPTATLLPNGTVLVAAGHIGGGEGTYLASAEIYDPGPGTWSLTGSMSTPRSTPTATLLPEGTVLVAGGYFPAGGGYQSSAEIYVPKAGVWSPTGSMNGGRSLHTATLLLNGLVLVSGGVGPSGYLDTAELYGSVPDTTAPQVLCDPADGVWHSDNVSLSCTADDPESGLANPADGAFTLTTTVTLGSETDDAATKKRSVCNTKNLCTVAVVFGNKIDRKAPTITVTSPVANATYQLSAVVPASYTCADGGSGVASCVGTVPSGSPIDTSSTGTKTFNVNVSDGIGGPGHVASASVTYSVVTGGGGGQASADLSLTLSAPAKVAPGGTLTYSIAVANRSNTTASGVVVADALPPGTVFANASPPGTYSNGTVTFNLGSIAGNATANMSFNVTVTAASGATLTNTAKVTAATQDLNQGNNSATKSTKVSK